MEIGEWWLASVTLYSGTGVLGYWEVISIWLRNIALQWVLK
jgi:hypothetical protein